MIGRRSVLAGLVLGSGMSSIGLGASCIVTPSQVEGPFYPVEFGELDADLTRVEGGSTRASGEVIEINIALDDDPSLVNSDPYGDGWMIKLHIEDETELDALLDADRYEDHIS